MESDLNSNRIWLDNRPHGTFESCGWRVFGQAGTESVQLKKGHPVKCCSDPRHSGTDRTWSLQCNWYSKFRQRAYVCSTALPKSGLEKITASVMGQGAEGGV